MIFPASSGVIVLLYLFAVIGTGLYFARRNSTDRFWVNERKTPWYLVGAAIIATQIGAGVLIGIVSATYAKGIGYAVAAACAVLFGFNLLGHFGARIGSLGRERGLVTIGEFFGAFYSNRVRRVVGLVVFVVYTFLAAAQIRALADIASAFSGAQTTLLVWCAVGLVIAYVATVGLRGDIFVAIGHFLIIVFSFLLIIPLLLVRDHHWLANVPTELLNPITFGGPLFLVAAILFGGAFPLVSAEFWQLIYSAESSVNLRRTFLGSSVVIVLVYLVCTMVALSLRADQITAQPDFALYEFIDLRFGSVLGAILVAGVFASVLSTANALMIVLAGALVRDAKILPDTASSRFLLTCGCGLVAGMLAMTFPSVVQLALNGIFVLCLLTIPFAGLIVKRLSEPGAFWSLVLGAVVTLALMPLLPTEAFVPGIGVALLTYISLYISGFRSLPEDL